MFKIKPINVIMMIHLLSEQSFYLNGQYCYDISDQKVIFALLLYSSILINKNKSSNHEN